MSSLTHGSSGVWRNACSLVVQFFSVAVVPSRPTFLLIAASRTSLFTQPAGGFYGFFRPGRFPLEVTTPRAADSTGTCLENYLRFFSPGRSGLTSARPYKARGVPHQSTVTCTYAWPLKAELAWGSDTRISLASPNAVTTFYRKPREMRKGRPI